MPPVASKAAHRSAADRGLMGNRLDQAQRAGAHSIVSWAAATAVMSLMLGACSRADAAGESESATATAPTSKVAAAASSSSAHTPATSANPAAKQAPCEALCARTAELRCGASASECMTGCLEMAGAPVCRTEMLAVLNCMNQHAVADWECDHSMASIRAGFCEAEQARVASCISGMN